MRNSLVPIMAVIALWFTVGCAASSNASRSSDRYHILEMSDNPAYAALDAELDALESETARVEDDYKKVESQVVARVHFSSGEDIASDAAIEVQLTATGVILIDANAYSKNEFVMFANKYLPGRCALPPRLTIEPGADYDSAAWILETFYSHGCVNVEISE